MRVNWGCSPDVTREYRDIKHPLPSPSSPSPLIQIQQCPCGLAPLGLVQSSNSNSDGLVAAPVAAREDLPVAVNPPSENLGSVLAVPRIAALAVRVRAPLAALVLTTRSKCSLICGTDECSVSEHLPESRYSWNGEMVEEFKEDVHGKRTKIDLMTLGKSEGRCHSHCSARDG